MFSAIASKIFRHPGFYISVFLLGCLAVYYLQAGQVFALISTTIICMGAAYMFLRLLQALERSVAKNAELEHLAYHDVLTGLPNRRLFNDRLTQALLRAKRSGQLVAVLFLDLDKFKEVNDTLGHAVGDILIQVMGERLLGCLREGDTIYRQGGDEFTVLLENIAKPEDVGAVAARIQAALEKPFLLGGHTRYITASIGISLYPNDGTTREELMIHADEAMYRAKDGGRNKYHFYTAELDARIANKVEMETALRHALDREELVISYQPQYELSSHTLVGVEAMLDWRRSDRGVVPDYEWQWIAEETGLIVPIAEWALLKACKQVKLWQEEGLPLFKLSMNLSAVQFKKDNLIECISGILNESRLDAKYVELDLADGISSMSISEVTDKLQELKKLGVSIAMDDLCAGLFTISNLKQLPMDTLKLDSALIRDLDKDRENQALAVGIIAMAERLQVNLIAKGVETKEQLQLLQMLNCKEAQGCLFSNPLAAQEFKEFLLQGVQ